MVESSQERSEYPGSELAPLESPADTQLGSAAPSMSLEAIPPSAQSGAIEESHNPMLDVHAPHGTVHTWKDFFIHLATISIGLLIAIGLEQTVEYIHHRQQRKDLEEDLLQEAIKNKSLIARDMSVEAVIPWLDAAISLARSAPSRTGVVSFSVPPVPCYAGMVGTLSARYFAPSDAVWAAAKDSGLIAVLPPDRSRIYARLEHNYDLLSTTRDHVGDGCERLLAMQARFGVRSADALSVTWSMQPEQVGQLGEAAANLETATRGMMNRLRWTLAFEEAIVKRLDNVDQVMMEVNQQPFEH
jgi:hypothetical protein